MSYRKLLLPLSDTQCGQVALGLGVQLAVTWKAHLAATIVRVDAASVAPLAGEGLSGAMIEDMMEATERESAGRAHGLEAQFAAAIRAAGVRRGLPQPGARPEPTAVLTTITGRDDDIIPSLARLSDLTILPHPHQDEDPGAGGCLHAVLFESGRPVLIAPRKPVATLGKRCCVAWNGTTESSAALWAILPWLRHADAVRVLHAGDYQRAAQMPPTLSPTSPCTASPPTRPNSSPLIATSAPASSPPPMRSAPTWSVWAPTPIPACAN